MADQLLIAAMEKLHILHSRLLEIANEKTGAIKHNNVAEISALLREEQKQLTAIQIAEQKRQQAVALLMSGDGLAPSADVIEKMNGLERERFIHVYDLLKAVIAELKATNALNQNLLAYGLQFVNLNLDLLAPEPSLPNYSKTRGEGSDPLQAGRSAFDSQA